jgi:hypothetical protein
MKLLYITNGTNGISGLGGLEQVRSFKLFLQKKDYCFEDNPMSLNEQGYFLIVFKI